LEAYRRIVVVLDDNQPSNAVMQESHGFLTRSGVKPDKFRNIKSPEPIISFIGKERIMDLYKEKTALITGASTGIGAAFATRLAAAGTHLILVARSEEKLRALASQLATQHHIRAEVIVADLSRVGAAHTVFEETQQRGLTVDILINNAGLGTYGPFETLDAEREQQLILLNIATLVDMTHHFLPLMAARRQGVIINVASLAAFQPIPYMAVYAASKAFVLSFSEALWGEYRTKGVRVLAFTKFAHF
jgi:short-subunit dehydrogenase